MMQINNYAKFINSIELFNKNNSIRVLLVIDFTNKKVIVVDGSRSDFRFKEYVKNDVKVNNGVVPMFKVIELNDSFKHFNCINALKITKNAVFFSFDDANNVLSKSGEDIFKYDFHSKKNEVYHSLNIWNYMDFRDSIYYKEEKTFEIVEENLSLYDDSSIEISDAIPIFHKEYKGHIKIVVATSGKVKCGDTEFTYRPCDGKFSKTIKVFEEIVKFPEPEFTRRDVSWTNSGEVPYYIKYSIGRGKYLYIRNDSDVYIETVGTEYTGGYVHGCKINDGPENYRVTYLRQKISLEDALHMLDEDNIKVYEIAKKYNFSEDEMKAAEKLYKEACREIYYARKDELIKEAQDFIDSESQEK